MKLLKLTLVVALLVTFITGCARLGFRDRSNDYRQAELNDPLQLPPELEANRAEDTLLITGLDEHEALPGEFEVPRPDAIRRDADKGKVRIQKLGDEQWVLVSGAPGEVYPRVAAFLDISRLAVANADASAGILETRWLTPEGDNIPRERYLFKVEQGVQRGTSEVYVKQADIRSGQNWPPFSHNPERMGLMVEILAQFLADSEEASSISMLAQRNVGVKGRIFLEKVGKARFLRVELPYDRAWAALSSALSKAGFEILDANRRGGRYTVSFVEEDEKKGGFFGLGGGSKAKTEYYVDLRQRKELELVITLERKDGERMLIFKQEELLELIKGYFS